MGKITKITLVIAAALVAVGMVLAIIGGATGGMQSIHFDRNGFSIGPEGDRYMAKDVITKREVQKEFKNIILDVDAYDVELVQGEEYAVQYSYYKKNTSPVVSVDGTTLNIKADEKERDGLFDGLPLLGIKSGSKIKIYYPENAQLEVIEIDNGAGDVRVKNLGAKELDVSLMLGNVHISNVNVDKMELSLEAGDCNLEDVNASTADLSLKLGDLAAKRVNTKALDAENSSGQITLQGNFEGKTKVACSLGDVSLTTPLEESTYGYQLKVSLGDITINGNNVSSPSVKSADTLNQLQIKSSAGDIAVNFEK